jgi:hypothetical protein
VAGAFCDLPFGRQFGHPNVGPWCRQFTDSIRSTALLSYARLSLVMIITDWDWLR